jgi:hypothetical protein
MLLLPIGRRAVRFQKEGRFGKQKKAKEVLTKNDISLK